MQKYRFLYIYRVDFFYLIVALCKTGLESYTALNAVLLSSCAKPKQIYPHKTEVCTNYRAGNKTVKMRQLMPGFMQLSATSRLRNRGGKGTFHFTLSDAPPVKPY